jgi:hypothetical protein
MTRPTYQTLTFDKPSSPASDSPPRLPPGPRYNYLQCQGACHGYSDDGVTVSFTDPGALRGASESREGRGAESSVY